MAFRSLDFPQGEQTTYVDVSFSGVSEPLPDGEIPAEAAETEETPETAETAETPGQPTEETPGAEAAAAPEQPEAVVVGREVPLAVPVVAAEGTVAVEGTEAAGAEAEAVPVAEVTLGGPEEDDAAKKPVQTVHEVLPTDTLQGICLKYGISVRALKKVNSFPGEQFGLLRELVIPHPKRIPPPPTADERIELAKQRLMQGARLNRAEAVAYLDIADGDVEAALASALADAAWAEEQAAAKAEAEERENARKRGLEIEQPASVRPAVVAPVR